MKKQHGGARKNAGRKVEPHMKRGPLVANLPKWLLDEMRAMDGTVSENVEKALVEFYQLKK